MKYLLTTFVTLVILVLIMLPGSSVPDVGLFPGIDKLAHFLLFLGWAVAVQNDFDFRWKWYVIVICGVAFSVLTEVIQIAIDGRTFDVNDLLADSAGLLFGVANGKFFVKLLRRIFPFVYRKQ